MLEKEYGNTGKMISAISMGGMRFADATDHEKSAQLVHYAHSKGINYFDTAPYYCNDNSEIIFGKAIREMPRDSFYVSTKCGQPDGDELRKSLERSLERLHVDKIDFFHIWCVVTLDQWKERIERGAVAAAIKAKEEGLIEHLCVSSHLPGKDIEVLFDQAPFEGVTLGYCAINFPYRQAAVDAAHTRNIGVITMNPLAGGVIPKNPDKFDFIRTRENETIVEAALRFNISAPGITSALVGFSDKSQVDQAVSAAVDYEPMSADDLESIKTKITDQFDSLCTGCQYCLPCPFGVEIPKLMDAWNMEALGSQSIEDRLKWHWNLTPAAADACTRCGLCEKRCPQQLPIRQRIEDIKAKKKG